MIRTESRLSRFVACAITFGMVNATVPMGAMYAFGAPIAKNVGEKLKEKKARDADVARRLAANQSRPLTAKEQRSLRGSAGENPYFAGQQKYDVVFQGVNVFTGNFSASVTDMSFEGGYGVPVNVTRSYSSNNPDEGPYGKGWSLSADVRSTAGGLLKSKGAPVRSVPSSFRERHTQEQDPNAENGAGQSVQPAEAVIAVDAGGTAETVQKDVDGVLTTPPWDKNTSDAQYEWTTFNGSKYQVLFSDDVTTPDGTVYHYAKQGSYPNGTTPWNDPNATPEPANVLKVTSVTDRQGNVTTYNYDQNAWVSFVKSNGTSTEHPLISVQMANGHHITFVWGDGSGGHPTNRVWKVKDNNDVRVALYAYDAAGMLTSVTTPGGKTTSYGYSTPYVDSNYYPSNLPVPTNVLSSVTDPRGLTTQIQNCMGVGIHLPSGGEAWTVFTYRLLLPNGAYYLFPRLGMPSSMGFIVGDDPSVYPSILFCSPTDTDGSFHWTESFPYGQGDGTFWIRATDEYHSLLLLDHYLLGRTYDAMSQDLVVETSWPGTGDGADTTNPDYQRVQTTTSYNFMGNPLSKVVEEDWGRVFLQGPTVYRSAEVDYAYWGADKYYQQKAVRDQAGRFSYTDYFDKNAQAGRKGQTYRVYDNKHASFYLDTSITPPPGTPQEKCWKYQLKPQDASNYSAQFDYDACGRPTSVLKLQNTAGQTWDYVETRTTYADDESAWGQAGTVVEDYGGINRTTQNLSYTSWGKPYVVRDAAGHVFTTNYDLDGVVQSVSEAQQGTIVSYSYGTSGLTNGQVVAVSDGITGVTQTISYTTSGGGLGLPLTVTESGPNDPSYSATYSYNDVGDRSSVVYSTPNGVNRWGYFNYIGVGTYGSAQRVFTSVAKLDASMNPTPEQYDYAYTPEGRMSDACFAQTPQNGYTPSAGSLWVDASHPAATRAHSEYAYDPAGRVTSLADYWDTYANGTYSQEAILANTCAYETSGLNRGLKTDSKLWTRQTQGQPNWSLLQTDSYGYDGDFDYLTSASYGDGLPNSYQEWSYDAAGNRNDSVCDHLNRALSIGGYACVNDVLGNRLSKGSESYSWDALNRMTSYTGTGPMVSYLYRADGMRVRKASSSGSTVYRYDGQMGMQDVSVVGGDTTVTDYGLGARGIDSILTCVNGGQTTTAYPMYDAHGNMISTLSMVSGGGYSYSPLRTYDAWGLVRSGATTGDPKGRYCANLGHKQDDESGLIYMRARYYEPMSGRFVSEDTGRKEMNYYRFAEDRPTDLSDFSGKEVCAAALGAILGILSSLVIGLVQNRSGIDLVAQVIIGGLSGALSGFVGLGIASLFEDVTIAVGMLIGAAGGASGSTLNSLLTQLKDTGHLNWGKLGRAAGLGGAFGLCFGAVGGAAEREGVYAAALGSIDGDLSGNTTDAAFDYYTP